MNDNFLFKFLIYSGFKKNKSLKKKLLYIYLKIIFYYNKTFIYCYKKQ